MLKGMSGFSDHSWSRNCDKALRTKLLHNSMKFFLQVYISQCVDRRAGSGLVERTNFEECSPLVR